MNNSTSCNLYTSVGSAILAAPYAVALVVCLVAAILVCALKLYRKSVYRLALYQVLAASAYATLLLFESLLVLKDDVINEGESFKPLCRTAATLDLYISWTKVLLALCVTIHLFCFAVFHKNLKNFEWVYVAVSLFIPGLIIIPPHATNTFGLSGSWCWIEIWKDNCPETPSLVGSTEGYVLFFAPTMLIVVVEMASMLIMVVVLYRRGRRRAVADEENASFIDDNQNQKALRQLFPLAAYPILYIIFLILPVFYRVYEGPGSIGLTVASGSCPAGWSLSTGITLIAHICVTRRGKRRTAKLRGRNTEDEGMVTMAQEGMTKVHSATSFPAPYESFSAKE